MFINSEDIRCIKYKYLFHRVCSSTLRIVEVTLCATTMAQDWRWNLISIQRLVYTNHILHFPYSSPYITPCAVHTQILSQATKINCPGATADGGNVLAFNDVTGSCDWAVNVPGCGGERCFYIYCIDNGYCQFEVKHYKSFFPQTKPSRSPTNSRRPLLWVWVHGGGIFERLLGC